MIRQTRPASQCPVGLAIKGQRLDKPSNPKSEDPQESLWSTLLPATPCEVVTRSIATAVLVAILYVGIALLYSHLR